jgi:hypothetical protein
MAIMEGMTPLALPGGQAPVSAKPAAAREPIMKATPAKEMMAFGDRSKKHAFHKESGKAFCGK